MASAEQPLKRQKFYASPPQPSPPSSPPPQPPSSLTPPPFSPEEILRRRRSKEEIRNVFECYKRIKFCIYQNDKRGIEEEYLSLIAATKGSPSVQRILSEYIPRYASCCPTALEAAVNVIINMHNQWFTVINKGEDIGGLGFEIAKTCILGLVDICEAAASEAPTSAVIQGICSAVFLNVLTFLISSFEEQSIFKIVDQRILNIHNVAESFSEFKEEFLEDDNSMILKLSNFRALCFLKIFFNHPKNSTAGCFELFESGRMEDSKMGKSLLHNLTTELSFGIDHVGVGSDGNKATIGSINAKSEPRSLMGDCFASHGDSFSNSKSPVLKNCLVGLVVRKDPSFRSWIFSRYRKLCNSSCSDVVRHVTSVLEGVFESFVQKLAEVDNHVNGDEDTSSSTKYVSQYFVPGVSSQHGSPSVASGRDSSDKASSIHFKNGSAFKPSTETIDCGESKVEFPHGDSGDASNARNLVLREYHQTFSPRARTPREFRSNSFTGRIHSAQIENNPVANFDFPATVLRYSGGSSNSPFESPKHDISSSHASVNLTTWYSDEDSAAMDVFPASKQLWLGSLGPDASEMLVRLLFEKFGSIDHLRCYPFKGYAVIDYRNLLDAVKAREVMQGRSPWGACLQIKFMDPTLGTRGVITGVSVSSSCHVYIGCVSSKWAKEEIIHEVNKILHKGPRFVTDISSEGALLIEFDSPKEASVAVTHLRWHRKERGSFALPPSSVCSSNLMVNAEGSRPGSVLVDSRNNFPASNIIGSPHAQNVLEKPYDGCMARTSGNLGKHLGASPPFRQDGAALDLTSPRKIQENYGPMMQNMHQFKPTWIDSGKLEGGRTGTPNQTWMYGKPGIGVLSGQVAMGPMPPPQTQGPSIASPQPVQPFQPSIFVRSVYEPPNSLWDARGLGHHIPPNPVPCVVPSNVHHGSLQAPPFLPASVTPLAKMQGSSLPLLDQIYSFPAAPPLSCLPSANMPSVHPQNDFHPPLPLQSDFRPPLPQPELPPPFPPVPPSPLPPPPPPPPPSHPPALPPPPSSPPPPPPSPPPSANTATVSGSGLSQKFSWKGILSKSGVYYCTMVSERVESDACNYGNGLAEPSEWPAKLDMTKRTDFRHVNSTFSNTPVHRREVCWLLPSSKEDHKGFQDFITYMKQRDCAGVIKIPASKSMWSRLLFILLYSPETCAMLSIPRNPSLCLIGLVLPKETNAQMA